MTSSQVKPYGAHDWALVASRWQDAFARVKEVGALITDPPFSSKTHDGHNKAQEFQSRAMSDGIERRELSYSSWSEVEAIEFAKHWATRTTGWTVIMTDHVLWGAYEAELTKHGRYTFAPVPVVIKGMTVRRAGDGPSSWCFWLCV